VTKQDLATPELAAALKGTLRAINPAASIVDASFGGIDFAPLLADAPPVTAETGGGTAAWAVAAGDRASARDPLALPSVHVTSGQITSGCLVFERALDWQMFGIWLTMLLHRHGDRVLRLKGLLNVGATRGPLLLEGVQHVMHAPRHLREWPDADRRSRVVLIVRDLDLAQIEESLGAFQDLAASV
jgi:G3E family GTPase